SHLQRPHIRPGDVARESAKSAEEDTDVSWRDRNWLATLLNRPAAIVCEPTDEGAHGIRQRLVDPPIRDPAAVAIRAGYWQSDDCRPFRDLGPPRLEWNVACLAPVRARTHHRRESCIDEGLQRGQAPEARIEGKGFGPVCQQPVFHMLVDS